MPPVHSKYDLQDLAKRTDLGYRVTNNIPGCPYDEIHGFTARHPLFRRPDHTIDEKEFESFLYLFPVSDEELVRSVLDHGVDGTADEQDIWISITILVWWAGAVAGRQATEGR